MPSSHDNNSRYSENGLATLQTIPLESEESVTINIEIKGIGLSENSEEWIIPPNEQQVIAFTVVPEFGQMAAFVMIITISTWLFWQCGVNFQFQSDSLFA